MCEVRDRIAQGVRSLCDQGVMGVEFGLHVTLQIVIGVRQSLDKTTVIDATVYPAVIVRA